MWICSKPPRRSPSCCPLREGRHRDDTARSRYCMETKMAKFGNSLSTKIPGWWFQLCFIFTRIWGRFPIWLYYIFQMGWWKTTKQIHFGSTLDPGCIITVEGFWLWSDLDWCFFLWKVNCMMKIGKWTVDQAPMAQDCSPKGCTATRFCINDTVDGWNPAPVYPTIYRVLYISGG